MDGSIFVQSPLVNSSCLSQADISSMIAGAQSATVNNAGAAMMVFFIMGCIVGGIIVYLYMKGRETSED
jgi:hypothetical protein